MPDAEKIEIKQVYQICVVVKDIQKAMENYWKTLGIGPWKVYTFRSPDLSGTAFRGKPEPYSMKLASARIGALEWELIQPLEGRSAYKEFLEQRGEGLHHVALAVDDFDKTVAALEKQGVGVLMSGSFRGTTFMYMDTQDSLGTLTELCKVPPGFLMPEPEACYPSSV
jgi:catechol 2,3-dioxygenase-like lactoylglutathione lyase family enzyme